MILNNCAFESLSTTHNKKRFKFIIDKSPRDLYWYDKISVL